MMVLSSMGNMDMVRDNLGYMKDFKPLNAEELWAVHKVKEIILRQNLVPCTACKYCIERCPKNIPIPDLISCWNDRKLHNAWSSGYYYQVFSGTAKAGDCLECGLCEEGCPQHINIRELLKEISKEFEV